MIIKRDIQHLISKVACIHHEAEEINIFSYPDNRPCHQMIDLFADSQLNHPTKERIYPVRGIDLRYWHCDNKAMLTVSGTVCEITLLK